MQYAKVVDDTVINIIVATPEAAASLGYTEVPDGVGVGYTLVDGQWTAPAAPVIPRLVYSVDFLARFLTAERIAIRASADPVVQDMFDMIGRYTQIDLDNVQIQQGTAYLVAIGLLTQARAVEVLS